MALCCRLTVKLEITRGIYGFAFAAEKKIAINFTPLQTVRTRARARTRAHTRAECQ